MNILNAILIAFLFFNCNYPYVNCKNKTKTCSHLLHRLAACQKEYLGCSTSHAVPVELCNGCQSEFKEMQQAYSNITGFKNCSMFFDHDRINVVQTTQNMLLGLWEKAFCNDCNSSSSVTFNEYLDKLNYCFNITKDDKMKCIACLEDYLNLNRFYTHLDQQNKGKICYDMQDAMNQTRVMWSKNLDCCHREFRIQFFLISTIFVGSLPIVFYVGAFFLTKRRERNHAMIHMSEHANDVRPLNGVNTATQRTRNNAEDNSLDSSNQISTHIKFLKNVNIESVSNDDDDAKTH